MEPKFVLFEHFLWLIHERLIIDRNLGNEKFSILKVFKLLFLVSAFSSDILSEKEDLLNDFNDFRAFPLGPVETDVYDYVKNKMTNFELTRNGLKLMDSSFNPDMIEIPKRETLNQAFNEFVSTHEKVFYYPAHKLVDLTHEWPSWYIVFDMYKNNETMSNIMSPNIIRNDLKTYEFPS